MQNVEQETQFGRVELETARQSMKLFYGVRYGGLMRDTLHIIRRTAEQAERDPESVALDMAARLGENSAARSMALAAALELEADK